jgi:hypothetical protein
VDGKASVAGCAWAFAMARTKAVSEIAVFLQNGGMVVPSTQAGIFYP